MWKCKIGRYEEIRENITDMEVKLNETLKHVVYNAFDIKNGTISDNVHGIHSMYL